MDEAYWHMLFASVLTVIMVLWRPTNNNQRYAFTPLLDNADDDEGTCTSWYTWLDWNWRRSFMPLQVFPHAVYSLLAFVSGFTRYSAPIGRSVMLYSLFFLDIIYQK